jgi:hypothetical protein
MAECGSWLKSQLACGNSVYASRPLSGPLVAASRSIAVDLAGVGVTLPV